MGEISREVALELRSFFFKALKVVAILIGIYTLYQVRAIMLLLFGTVLFASTIRPLALYLKDRRIAPISSILVIYLVFLASLIGAIPVLLPAQI